MIIDDFFPRQAPVPAKVASCYRIAYDAFVQLGLFPLLNQPNQREAWLAKNRIFDQSSGSYRLRIEVENEIRRAAAALDEGISSQLVAYTGNLLAAFLFPRLDESELDAPPTEANFPSWFFYNYGLMIERVEDTAPVFFAIYLAIRRCIELEHPFVGGFMLSVFNLPENMKAMKKGGAWIPDLNRIVLIVSTSDKDFEAKLFASFLHEYSHFLDCCIVGKNDIFSENRLDPDFDLQYFSSCSAGHLGFARSQIAHNYFKANFQEAKNIWWRKTDYSPDVPAQDNFTQQYKNYSPAECLAEMYSMYFKQGRRFEKMRGFYQQEKEWFRETFLVELKRAVATM